MKCKSCPALVWEGYEYPETSCVLGTLSESVQTDDGCKLHYKTIQKAIEEIEQMIYEEIIF